MSEVEDNELSKIKIIIVDDCKLTTVGLKTMLQMQPDMEVVEIAVNGLVAVSMAERLKPDIILMDVGMPILDGIEATKRIKQIDSTIKIVVLTSHDNEKDVFDALLAGAKSYCMKDIEPKDLINVIKMTNNGASWLDPRIAHMVLNKLSNKEEKKSDLTEREQEILILISKGYTNNHIAEMLCISLNTVKTHIKSIFSKLEVNDRTEAAMKAIKEDII